MGLLPLFHTVARPFRQPAFWRPRVQLRNASPVAAGIATFPGMALIASPPAPGESRHRQFCGSKRYRASETGRGSRDDHRRMPRRSWLPAARRTRRSLSRRSRNDVGRFSGRTVIGSMSSSQRSGCLLPKANALAAAGRDAGHGSFECPECDECGPLFDGTLLGPFGGGPLTIY